MGSILLIFANNLEKLGCYGPSIKTLDKGKQLERM